ncbi:hypothetical protein P154DRAFT_614675 [Amniculicola lignicola CBS 123094]|uniref:Uncharacterized protein n=1 Tax=Amniculicola lignicola CBS 123094 TaxID=1392246 RepID=A0A6A5X315_9PLEO|nr:hypothetical protein P154DRAFT_614675 [Amniculicola lignicola CBS 123094]
MAEKEAPVAFTPREMEVLALAWQCMESEPKINMAKLAQLTGYTHASAGVTFGKIKRKLKIFAASSQPMDYASTPTKKGTTSTGAVPRSSAKRYATKPKSGAAGFGDESPTKKSRKNGGRMKNGNRGGESDDDDEFKDVKVKKEEVGSLLEGVEEYYNRGQGQGQGWGPYAGEEAEEDI